MSNHSIRFETIFVAHKEIANYNEIQLFNETEENDSSVLELIEQEIVKWLFNNTHTLNLIIEKVCGLSSEDVFFQLEVKEPLLNRKEQKNDIGDIDAVIIPKENPEKSVIIEFKRIKINTLENKTVKIHKVNRAREKGFSQIKRLRKFNYFKTYLGLIVEEDARNINSANTLIRYSKDSQISQIFNINKDNKLDEKAGLIFLKITQPTGENFQSRFNFGIAIDKKATEIKQNPETTKRVIELLNLQ